MDSQRFAAIKAAILPIACAAFVMLVGTGVHQYFRQADGQCCSSTDVKLPAVAPERAPAPGALAPEIYARRINYMAAVQFQILAIAATLGFSCVLLVPLVRRGQWRWRGAFVALAVTLGAATSIALITAGTSPMLIRLLDLTVRTEFPGIDTVRLLLERLTSVAATVLVATAALLLIPVPGSLEKRLKSTAEHHTRLSYLLGLGTLLLAGNVLLKLCLTRWAAAYFPDDKAMQELTQGIVSGWAVYDSLFLAAAYIPAAVVLRLRLKAYAGEIGAAARPAWFEPQWLTVSPLQDLPRVVAILLPALIGQAPDIASLMG